MKRISLVLTPEQANDRSIIEKLALKKAKVNAAGVAILKKSIDARKSAVVFRLEVLVGEEVNESAMVDYRPSQNLVSAAQEVIIIGSGPAGLFAALRLIELGIKPIVLERGKDVRSRRRDIALINREGLVDTNSNYCFGEGGAGTYSDGKLYTRSKKKGNVKKVLEVLHHHGAKANILYEAHPHIGTNKLPGIIASMRDFILAHGGEFRFDHKVEDLLIERGQVTGVMVNGEILTAKAVILATGHSARDIYELFAQKGIAIEPKPFALGVRVEHPQALIDSIQYHCDVRGPYLPAAAYALVSQVEYQKSVKGVFSFCMCPGGFIVPSATAPGEVVVNGMSPSRRDSKFANSGIVVAVDDKEVGDKYGNTPLRYMEFQREIEQFAFSEGGESLAAPAQRLNDFVNKKISQDLPLSSYQPGTKSVIMDNVLPEVISQRLRLAFRQFNKRMPGYLTNEAIILGVESRTSSPVRIPRNKESLEHVTIKGLFPCGEGAGYAGGIVSAAIDGENCAEMAARLYCKVDL